MEITAGSFVTISAIIGSLVFLVSIITEVTKSVTLLSKIPSNIQVIVLSLTLTMVTYFAYISYTGNAIIWYYVVATLIAGFIVAYVVLFGWDKFVALYKRFRNISLDDLTDNTVPGTTSAKSAKSANKNENKQDFTDNASSIDASKTATTLSSDATKQTLQ